MIVYKKNVITLFYFVAIQKSKVNFTWFVNLKSGEGLMEVKTFKYKIQSNLDINKTCIIICIIPQNSLIILLNIITLIHINFNHEKYNKSIFGFVFSYIYVFMLYIYIQCRRWPTKRN